MINSTEKEFHNTEERYYLFNEKPIRRLKNKFVENANQSDKTEAINTNAIFDNLKNGFYNTEMHVFKKVSFDEAESYAGKGGLAYAIWKIEGGIGHIGTVIGGYGGDGTKKMINIKIFQAGSTFGEMNYSQGFGANRVSEFYYWMKK